MKRNAGMAAVVGALWFIFLSAVIPEGALPGVVALGTYLITFALLEGVKP